MKISRYIALAASFAGMITMGHAEIQTKSSNSLQSVLGNTWSLSLRIQNNILRPLQVTTATVPVAVPIALNIVTLTGVPQATPQNSAQSPATVSILPLTIQPNIQVKLLTIPINSLNTPPFTLNFTYALANNSNINYPVTIFTQPGNPCAVTSVQQISNPGAVITVNSNNTLVFN